MEPDRDASTRLDAIERAHLRDPADATHTIHRHPAPPDLAPLARRYWIPVWSVPPGREAPQRVLQYPVALIVISGDYSRFYGVATGVSEVVLEGEGWAVGVLFQPAAGSLLSGGSMARWTDRFGDLAEVLGPPGADLTAEVRAAMGAAPDLERSRREAMDVVSAALRGFLPVDEEGLLVNRIVEVVDERTDITRVDQLCEAVDLGERALQRLTRRRLGLSPKWVIQRRRLHEAAERLREGSVDLAGLAAELGYADQPHLTRDFRTVTGMTPGEFAALFD